MGMSAKWKALSALAMGMGLASQNMYAMDDYRGYSAPQPKVSAREKEIQEKVSQALLEKARMKRERKAKNKKV